MKSNATLSVGKETFFILSEHTQISFNSLEKEYYDISLPQEKVKEDIPLGLTGNALLPEHHLIFPKLMDYTVLGRYNGKNVMRVNLISYDSQYKKFLKSIKFEISGDKITLLSDSLLYSHLPEISQFNKNAQLKIQKPKVMDSDRDEYSIAGKEKLKIFIKKEGIYKLSGKLIEKAGWKISGTEPDYLKIITQGQEIPLYITGTEDGSFDKKDIIEFWGEPIWSNNSVEKSKNIYTDYAIYWLISADTPGWRLGNQAAVGGQISTQQKLYPVSYPFTQFYEENNIFLRLPYAQNVITEDYWVYSSSINGGEKKEFTFQIKTPYIYSTSPVHIDCKLRGQCAEYSNHPVEIYLNNQFIGSTFWHDYDEISFSSNAINPVYLQENENQLTVVNKSSSGLFAQLYLDWFQLTYPREFITNSDFLLFNPPQDSRNKIVHFEIKGFTNADIQIFKNNICLIYNPDIQAVIDTLGTTSYTVSFEDRIGDESLMYAAVTREKISIPDSIVFLEHDNLRSSELGADYVIISPINSLGIENKDIQDFKADKEDQGLTVTVADLQDIYNEFNYGVPDPEAIRMFLKYTVRHWYPSPRYVLLVGDGTINPEISLQEGNLIPVPLYQTEKYGAAPSDYYYSLLDEEDAYPDIAVGRLPVQNTVELKNVIQKIIDYENNARGIWRNDYLMISAGTRDGDFGYQAETIINDIVSPSINPKRMYLSGSINDPYLGGTEDLLRHFRNGTAWVNFRGHGGGAIWSDGGLLDIDDIPLLENRGKLPFITSMTCFTGDYASSQRSLGESLILEQETGAVAFWGSTGLGWLWNDYYLLKELFQCFTLFPEMSIGELINKAKTAYLLKYSSNLAYSEAYHYLLLGDPALQLTIPNQKTKIYLPTQAVKKDDMVHIQGESALSNLNIHLSLTDSSYAEKYSETFSLDEKNWDFELPIPPELLDTQCGVRAYLWDPDNNLQMRGFTSFSYGTSFFDSLSVVPEAPTFQDSLYFTVQIEDVRNIKIVNCIIQHPSLDTLTMYNVGKVYRTNKVPPYAPGTLIRFHYLLTHEDGSLTSSKSKEIVISSLADVRVQSLFLSGRDTVKISADLSNTGQTEAKNVVVEFSSQPQGFYAQDTVSLSPSQTIISSVTFYPIMGINTVTVSVDPDSLIPEFSQKNNLVTRNIVADRFWVTPEQGTTLDFNTSDTVGIPDKIVAYIPPKAVNQPTCVVFELLDNLPFSNSTSPKTISEIYSLSFPGLTADQQLNQEAFLLFHQDTTKTLYPYKWDTTLHTWVICPYQTSNGFIRIKATQGGYFNFFHSDDSNPPYIEVQIENQAFTQNSYVSKNPLFNILLQDESSLDLRPSYINVIIDDLKLPYTDLIIPDTLTNLNNVSMSFRPDFEPGKHSLQIIAQDIHGNINTSPVYTLKVGSELNINYLGNHPNPFRSQTIFVYVLTDIAQDVSLKIYTVSGKLIRTLSDNTMTSPDYHEIVWDGRDEWGNLVANGVYFFKLTAKGYNKTREVTGKIAKIR